MKILPIALKCKLYSVQYIKINSIKKYFKKYLVHLGMNKIKDDLLTNCSTNIVSKNYH